MAGYARGAALATLLALGALGIGEGKIIDACATLKRFRILFGAFKLNLCMLRGTMYHLSGLYNLTTLIYLGKLSLNRLSLGRIVSGKIMQ